MCFRSLSSPLSPREEGLKWRAQDRNVSDQGERFEDEAGGGRRRDFNWSVAVGRPR